MKLKTGLCSTLVGLKLLACENPSTLEEGTEFSTEFQIRDSTSATTKRFSAGQDIFFRYAIENGGDETQAYIIPDTGPFVTFEISDDQGLVGTTDDGMAYAQVIVEGSLSSSDTLRREVSWLANDLHVPIPPGDYEVTARPRLKFEDVVTPSPETLEFSVICNSTQGCDSLPFVRITDASPASLQKDPFELQSVEIDEDTISVEITYAGGCKTHDFALFMSPAAFLESFPVQANLFLRHNNNDDGCEALIRETLSFDLRPIARLYQEQYARQDEIILNVFEYFEDEPGRHLNASYFPE
ncbi:hypothetical protein GWO43_06630 [candidate division KSB1 bacterium]|nr:hypothetical protein [candidate division KSB1 bacterium]NIR72543.1 hypothetical protein [candidate division KSB1 bacterium]NIS23638.1 hypothetical protein [candidate division KSB1 bacterium]NIT70562.1 hypothetical protein [candidate division KSB1 bacterium]NIU24280.1 hypothetical protein [candidate division KSB1 bacterium]